MENYNHYKPTKLVFGKGEITSIGAILAEDGVKNVLLHFGKGSIFKTYMEGKESAYNQVVESLNKHGIKYVDAGDQVPNPREDIAIECFKKGREAGCEAVLALGGGSVYDSAKFICAMNDFAETPEKTFESVFLNGVPAKNPLPLYGVITMSGTGSEMNQGSVITSVKGYKVGGATGVYPKVSILDPELQYSLPAFQVQCGLMDALCHIYESYSGAGLKNDGAIPVTITHMCEAVMKDILTYSTKAVQNPQDYQTRAEICFQCMIALDYSLSQGFLPSGCSTHLWSCHQISHVITTFFGLSHGASNALVMLGIFDFMAEHPEAYPTLYAMHERMARNVFGVSSIKEAREAFAKHLQSVGLPTTLSEVVKDENLEEAKKRIVKRYGELWRGVVEYTDEQASEILANLK